MKKKLLIIYYNGHGHMEDGKLIWSARREWNLNDTTYPALSWYNLQNLLEKAGFDVLLILDCCHAAGAVTKGSSTMEVLAGCGRENMVVAPGAGNVGSPFTSTLIKHLKNQAAQPNGLLITELQTLLSYDEVLKDQSPIHVFLSGHYSPIKLKPLVPATGQGGVEIGIPQSIDPPLKIIVAIYYREGALPDHEVFARSLKSQSSREIARIEVEDIVWASPPLDPGI